MSKEQTQAIKPLNALPKEMKKKELHYSTLLWKAVLNSESWKGKNSAKSVLKIG